MLITIILGYVLLWAFLIGLLAIAVVGTVWALRAMVTAMREETRPLFHFGKEEK